MADKIENDAVWKWLEDRNERGVSTAVSLNPPDERINVDTSGGAFAIELADTGDLQTPTGKRLVFVHTTGADLFTIEPKSGDANSATINGVSSFTVPLPGEVWALRLYQNNWFIDTLYTTLQFFASHDRQLVDVTGPITTTSATFVDVAGAMLTTKDLGETGTYSGSVVADLEHSQNKKTVTFRITIDGTPTGREFVAFSPQNPNDPFQITAIANGSGVPAGVDAQLQWKTESGTATIVNLTMQFDGIPDSAVKS